LASGQFSQTEWDVQGSLVQTEAKACNFKKRQANGSVHQRTGSHATLQQNLQSLTPMEDPTQTTVAAMSNRGWSPLNRKLLSHLQLLPENESTNNQQPSPSTTLPELNVDNGMPGTIIDQLQVHSNRNGGITR
jgi:phage terminase large subunit GpA-like protein